jgi:hypothetical protein
MNDPLNLGLHVCRIEYAQDGEDRTRHVIATLHDLNDGAGVEFRDPVTDDYVGFCGIHRKDEFTTPLAVWLADFVS